MKFDPRYKPSGLYTDMLSMQSNNGVMDHMTDQPSYWTTGPTVQELKASKLQSWNRPTLSWSLQCDQ